MSDLSWSLALSKSIGGSQTGGVSDYDQLENRPLTNLEGSGVVIAGLDTGVYNIDGTWKMTADDDERETLKDDLFYVSNDGAEVKLTWVRAGKIKTFTVPVGGTKDDIREDSLATTGELVKDMVGQF